MGVYMFSLCFHSDLILDCLRPYISLDGVLHLVDARLELCIVEVLEQFKVVRHELPALHGAVAVGVHDLDRLAGLLQAPVLVEHVAKGVKLLDTDAAIPIKVETWERKEAQTEPESAT